MSTTLETRQPAIASGLFRVGFLMYLNGVPEQKIIRYYVIYKVIANADQTVIKGE